MLEGKIERLVCNSTNEELWCHKNMRDKIEWGGGGFKDAFNHDKIELPVGKKCASGVLKIYCSEADSINLKNGPLRYFYLIYKYLKGLV